MKSGVAILWEIIILQIVIIQNLDCDPSSILFKKEKNTNNGLVLFACWFFWLFWEIFTLKCVRENYNHFFKLFHFQK